MTKDGRTPPAGEPRARTGGRRGHAIEVESEFGSRERGPLTRRPRAERVEVPAGGTSSGSGSLDRRIAWHRVGLACLTS
jgi:hypothetical protein